MSPDLDAVFAECDALGVSLGLKEGKIAVVAPGGLPETLADAIRGIRESVISHLTDHDRPAPDLVPFVALNLDVFWVWSGLVRGVPAFYVDDRPFYCLTPQVWFYLACAIDRAAERKPEDAAKYQAGAILLADLGRWVERHYRPDQIRRACQAAPSLPKIRRPDRSESSHAAKAQGVPDAKAAIRTPARV